MCGGATVSTTNRCDSAVVDGTVERGILVVEARAVLVADRLVGVDVDAVDRLAFGPLVTGVLAAPPGVVLAGELWLSCDASP